MRKIARKVVRTADEKGQLAADINTAIAVNKGISNRVTTVSSKQTVTQSKPKKGR